MKFFNLLQTATQTMDPKMAWSSVAT